jgi:uncharacterized RDD family membrane protein YckC
MSETAAAPVAPLQSSAAAAQDAPCSGFWRRVAAVVVDNLVLIIPLVIVAYFVHAVLGLLLVLLYGAYYESSEKRATLGKMVCGIFVTGVDGERIGFGRALGRQVLKLLGNALSVITWLIFFLPVMFTRRHQGLHDMAVKTVVLRDPAKGISDIAVAIIGGLIPALFLAGIVAAIAIPAYNDFLSRARMTGVLAESRTYQAAVEKYYASNQKLPAGLQEIGLGAPASPDVKSFSLRNGRIVVEPAGMNPSGVLILTPAAEGIALSWKCASDGLRTELLPAACR